MEEAEDGLKYFVLETSGDLSAIVQCTLWLIKTMFLP